MRKIGFGVIGCGSIANSFHLPELRQIEEAELIAVADIRPNRARATAERFKVPLWFTDYNKLLELEDVEAVIIATPHPTHAKIAIDSIEAGKHVMIQKPMATSVEEANFIVEIAKKHPDLKVMVLPFIYYDIPVFDYTKNLLDRGELGKICMLRVRIAHQGPEASQREIARTFNEELKECWFLKSEKAHGGVLLDLGIYSVTMITLLLGRVRKIIAYMATLAKDADVEDNATLILEMNNGAIATVECSWTQPIPSEELSIYGTKGIIYLDKFRNKVRVFKECNRSWITPSLPREKEPQHTHRHFIRSILEDREPIGTVEDGAYLIRILDAAYRSAILGKFIEIL